MFLEAVSYNVPQSGLEASGHRIIRFKKKKEKDYRMVKQHAAFSDSGLIHLERIS